MSQSTQRRFSDPRIELNKTESLIYLRQKVPERPFNGWVFGNFYRGQKPSRPLRKPPICVVRFALHGWRKMRCINAGPLKRLWNMICPEFQPSDAESSVYVIFLLSAACWCLCSCISFAGSGRILFSSDHTSSPPVRRCVPDGRHVLYGLYSRRFREPRACG